MSKASNEIFKNFKLIRGVGLMTLFSLDNIKESIDKFETILDHQGINKSNVYFMDIKSVNISNYLKKVSIFYYS